MLIKTEEKLTNHPMELLLGIESGTTITEYREVIPATPVEMPFYDEKDNEIELQLEEVYGLALGTVSLVQDEIERVEGKYKSSLAETATQSLNIALGAIREKRLMKEHKDKILSANYKHRHTGNNTTNNNILVGNRNEMLKLLADQQKQLVE